MNKIYFIVVLFLFGCDKDINYLKSSTFINDPTVTVGGFLENRRECSSVHWERIDNEQGRVQIQYICKLSKTVDILNVKKNEDLKIIENEIKYVNNFVDGKIDSLESRLVELENKIVIESVELDKYSRLIDGYEAEKIKLTTKEKMGEFDMESLKNAIKLRDKIREDYKKTLPELPNYNMISSYRLERASRDYPNLKLQVDKVAELESLIDKLEAFKKDTTALKAKRKNLLDVYYSDFKGILDSAESDVVKIESKLNYRKQILDKLAHTLNLKQKSKENIAKFVSEIDDVKIKLDYYKLNYQAEIDKRKGVLLAKIDSVNKKYNIDEVFEIILWTKNLNTGGFVESDSASFYRRKGSTELIRFTRLDWKVIGTSVDYNSYIYRRLVEKI